MFILIMVLITDLITVILLLILMARYASIQLFYRQHLGNFHNS